MAGKTIVSFPHEFILDIHSRFTNEMVDERIDFTDRFVEANKEFLSPAFLNREVPGQKALIYYQGKRYAEAAEQYKISVEHSAPSDMLYFHEHGMVARCYRLAGEFEKSEEWIQKAYAQKHLMSHALELLDLLADHVNLLTDTGRKLDVSFLPDIRWIIMETGMEIKLDETDAGRLVMEMKELNHKENISFSRASLLIGKNREEGLKALRQFIQTSKIRYYKQMAQEYLAAAGKA